VKSLYPHQTKALEMLRESLVSGRRRPMIMSPTGSGKTVLASAVVQGALAKRKRVIFTVPAISLIDQTVERFWEDGIRDIGVIQANHPLTNFSRPIQVASVQTLARREFPIADIVVVDEAHRWFEFYGDWMERPEWQRVPFVGLSATPWTKGLGKHYDDLIIATTTSDLIAQGYLSGFRVLAPSHPDLSKVRTVAGDYHEGDLAEIMGEAKLVGDVVETWRRYGEGRPTLCFAVDRAHAKSLQESFLAAGIRCGYIDAYTDLDERESIRRSFEAGNTEVVCNVGCLTTGVDWDVRCIILARPTKSEMLFVQIIGRGLRTADGKDDCLILDHTDTHLRLGFVTDINHHTLDGGEHKPTTSSEPPPPKPKECPKCRFLRPVSVRECPVCGFVPERKWTGVPGDGELTELRAKPATKAPAPAEKQAFYAQLLGLAADRGKGDSWVLANYRAKYGEWPHKKHGVIPQAPTPEVVSWVKSRQIAWAKKRAA
jgi:DNA repair protein RadD